MTVRRRVIELATAFISRRLLETGYRSASCRYGSVAYAVTYTVFQQDAQLSQRDHAAGCASFGQKWKTGTGRQYFTDIIGLFSTIVT